MAETGEAYFEEHKAHEQSNAPGPQALRGGAISVTMQYGNVVLQIVSAIVLARLLTPEDFGLVAIIMILTSFAPSLIDFGLGDAAVQRIKITQGQVSSLFWLSSGIGLSIAVVLAACSPLIAWIFREPRLEAIAVYSSPTFILCGYPPSTWRFCGEGRNLLRSVNCSFWAHWQDLQPRSLRRFAVTVIGRWWSVRL